MVVLFYEYRIIKRECSLQHYTSAKRTVEQMLQYAYTVVNYCSYQQRGTECGQQDIVHINSVLVHYGMWAFLKRLHSIISRTLLTRLLDTIYSSGWK